MTPRNHAPDISYIVSAYNRPQMLLTALSSLMCQTHTHFEVIICDNADQKHISDQHKRHVDYLQNARFKYVRTAGKTEVSDCYWSAEYVVKEKNLASGTWLCFPCDDTYLVPEFGQRMLKAAYSGDYDLVVCGDVIVGPECNGNVGYKPWNMVPRKASKTTLMVRASAFHGFTGKLHSDGAVLADYHLSGQFPGRTCVIPEQYMVVHN